MDCKPKPSPKRISLVFPVYNEGPGMDFLKRSVEDWATAMKWETEVILVDDGSSDDTALQMRNWSGENPLVKSIFLSRNFGHQIALTAGLHYATGDAIVILDADLQDPLEAIPPMVEKYEEGFDIVSGRRGKRLGETVFKKSTAWLFYRLMQKFVHARLPADVGDFRLVSREALDVLLRMKETHRFLRGMFAWLGFPQTTVVYERKERQFGETKYPFSKMLKLAWEATLSFSTYPIKLISLAGIGTSCFGLCYGLYALYSHFIEGQTVPGWTSTIMLISIIGGLTLLSLGIIGEYVGRIYEEIKARPLFIVGDTLNTSKAYPFAAPASMSVSQKELENTTKSGW